MTVNDAKLRVRRLGAPLEGRVALITGCGTRISLVIAEAFLAAGVRVVITGHREAVLQAPCERLGARASWQQGDVSQPEAQAALMSHIDDRIGVLNVLVNHAGTHLKNSVSAVTDAEFFAVMRTNLQGLFAISREVGRRMADRGDGVMLNIASMAAVYGIPRIAAYAASKSAVVSLTGALAIEFDPFGVWVNAISPAFIYSDMSARALYDDPERKQKLLRVLRLGAWDSWRRSRQLRHFSVPNRRATSRARMFV